MNAPFFFAADAALRRALPSVKARLFLTILAIFGLAVLQSPAHAQLLTNEQLLGSHAGSSEYFGYRVAASGDTVVVTDYGDRSAYVYVRNGAEWVFQQRLTGDHHNSEVAIDGDTLVIGGAVYVRSAGVWTQQWMVPGELYEPRFALQGDTLVVGLPYPSRPTQNQPGSFAIYVRNGTTWTYQGGAGGSDTHQALGYQVALDGDTAIIGIESGYFGHYVYVRNGNTWTQQGRLRPPYGGGSVAIEGNIALTTDNAGGYSTCIFERTGTTWNLIQTLPGVGALDINGGIIAAGDADGTHLFARTGSGWTEVQKIGNGPAAAALTRGGKVLVRGESFIYLRDPSTNGVAHINFVPPPAAPGSGWRDFDVGAVGLAGSSTDNGATVAVRGSGADIQGNSDQFHYRTESMTGDGAIIARVDSAGAGHPWSKIGIMAREDIASASRNVMAFVATGSPVGMQVRSATANTTTATDAPWLSAPLWLMLAREGNLFATYRSNDGDNWTPIGSATVAMPPTIHVGLAVSSHDNTTLNTGTFSGIEIVRTDTPPPPPNDPPAAPTSLQAGNQTATTVTLTWTDSSSDETGFEIQRASGSSGAPFAVVTTTAANATSYLDSALTPDTEYTYRVRATRNGTFSGFSNTFIVRTLPDSNGGAHSVDIGLVGQAGSTAESGNAIALTAGGEDIWNQADGFRFYYRQWTGDGSVTAHVAALSNTHAWAKAGVMIRETLAPGSVHAAMVLTADNVCGFVDRPTTGASSEFTGGAWLNAPYWVRITRSGNVFSGYVSPDGVTWTLVGSRTIAMASGAYVGLAACSHTTSTLTTASFDNVTLPEGTPPPPPPSVWAQQSWGSAQGSVASSESTVTVNATGDDIANNADSGVFAWRNWSGTGEAVARVDSLTATHPWAKAGIMFRAGTGPDAANAFVAITPGVGAIFQARSVSGGTSTLVKQDWNSGPGAWVKLVRQGTDFAAYYSNDEGVTWVLLGSQSIAMPTDIQMGFAVSSHDPNAATTAIFSHLHSSP